MTVKGRSVYTLGSIPSTSVWPGRTLSFCIDTRLLDSTPRSDLEGARRGAEGAAQLGEECARQLEAICKVSESFHADQIDSLRQEVARLGALFASFEHACRSSETSAAAAASAQAGLLEQATRTAQSGLMKLSHLGSSLEQHASGQIDVRRLEEDLKRNARQAYLLAAMAREHVASAAKALTEESAQIVAMSVDHPPLGEVLLDSQTACFTYVPDPEDKIPFDVRFSARSKGEPTDQTITITPIPELRPELDTVTSYPTKPVPSSTLYLQRSSTCGPDDSEYHLISGVEVILEQGQENGLWETYCKNPRLPEQSWRGRVKSLAICADRLVIRGKVPLPEIDLTIHCREIAFEDKGDEVACIDTTPIPYAQPARSAIRRPLTPAEDGLHGAQAGRLTLYAERVTVPEGSPVKRFILRGGNGQAAGKGLSGSNGKSRTDWFTQYSVSLNDSGIHKATYTWSFDPPAVYLHYDFHWAASTVAKDSCGAPEFPTNGEDAIAPGRPGNAGDGGVFKTNLLDAYARHVENGGGYPGAKAENVDGGDAGYPRRTSMYHAKGALNLFTGWHVDEMKAEPHADPDNPQLKITEKVTRPGISYEAPVASRSTGRIPDPELATSANAWLHPHQLQAMLQYARDALLAGQGAEVVPMLRSYQSALNLEAPAELGWGSELSLSSYMGARTEVAVLLHRIESNLDYYGNPAGWTPMLSLPAWLEFYDKEVDEALRTLLLVEWVGQKYALEQEATQALQFSIERLNEETAQAVAEIEKSQGALQWINGEIDSLERSLWNLQNDLKALTDRLQARAEVTLSEKAMIHFGVQTCSAILSVIPYGQPALGSLGSLASVIEGYKSEDPYSTTGGIFDVLASYTQANLSDQASRIVAATKKPEDEKSKQAKEKADKLNHVGKTLGPALGKINEGLKGLRVPQSEVDVELARLEAQTPEFGELVDRIKALNARKAELVGKLDSALQVLCGAYGQVTANLDAVSSFSAQRGKKLALLDHESLLYVRSMGQRARENLTKYLYCLIKAYESTMFRPMSAVNYQLTNILDRITVLLTGEEGHRRSVAIEDLGALASSLKPLLRDNLRIIEQKLLDDYQVEHSITLECGLSSRDTPEVMNELNRTGEVIFNLHSHEALYLTTLERMKLGSIEVRPGGWDFKKEPDLEVGTMMLTFEPLEQGIVRSTDDLYLMRSPARSGEDRAGGSSRMWGATYHFSDGTTELIRPSNESLELLAHLLHDIDSETTEKLAKPSAWTDIRIRFHRLSEGVPDLEAIRFKVQINALKATGTNVMLDVRTRAADAPVIRCAPEDVNARTDGLGSFCRFFPKGSTVTLVAPSSFGEKVFSHWDIIDADVIKHTQSHDSQLEIRMDRNVRVFCNFDAVRQGRSVAYTIQIPHEVRTLMASAPDQEIDRILGDRSLPVAVARAGPADPLLLRNAPSVADSVTLGVIPRGTRFTALEGPVRHEGRTWRKINVNGLVGWVLDEG